jgi:threonine synthase
LTNVNYISTRGRAPVLGFEDVLLAGLARDGGLYLPDQWPQLSREMIASFAGRPFAEVAVEVILPFTGGTLTRAQLRAMADEAYASFGHPATTPLVQIDPQTFVLELFHGPTLAFKDVAMQLLARMMDHVLAKRGQRATIVGATSGDTGGAAIEAFRSSERVDVVILFPDGRVSDDDDADGEERPRGGGEGDVRRLPSAREGDVQRSRFPRPGEPLGRQLDQLGAHRRAGVVLLRRGGGTRRAAS